MPITDNELMNALWQDDLKTATTLIKNGFDVNKPYNNNGWTPFMWVCKEFPEVDLIKLCVEHGGDINRRNKDGETPFLIASRRRSSPETLEYLLDCGANINDVDYINRNNAILNVITHPQAEMRKNVIQFLVDRGIDLNHRNRYCRNFYDIARERNFFSEFRYDRSQSSIDLLSENESNKLYDVISDTSLQKMIGKVNKRMKNGWRLAGGISTLIANSGYTLFYQAIKR